MAKHNVVFQPAGSRGRFESGTVLRTAARSLGVEIESICGENATCGKCVVAIESGRRTGVESDWNHAGPMGADESAYLAKRTGAWTRMGLDPDRLRLSCRAEVRGDLVVFVPEWSRGNRQIIRKSATDRAVEVRPTIRRYYVEVEPPTLADPLGDVDRVAEELASAMERVHGGVPAGWDARDLRFDLEVMRSLPIALREGDWAVTVAVRNGAEVVDVRPGFHETSYGAAVDIGSTAIALYLCDLASGEVVATESMMNPQTAIGDDVMSRISYEMSNEDGLSELHRAVLSSVDRLVRRACRSAGLAPDDVLDLVVVGNTVMHHYFLGLSAAPLGIAPYVPAVQQPLDIRARDLDLEVNPSAGVHLLPLVAGFVGADAMAVVLAEEPHLQDEELLIIDVGTNAELILGNRDRLLCTSTPTGPAFEGAHIEYGMRAAPGAIETVRIDPDGLEPTYTVIPSDDSESSGVPEPVKGICGSAIIDAVAELFRVGIIDSRGRPVAGVESPRIRTGETGWEYVVAWEKETRIGREIPITLDDVRQIQLAKAAVHAAARVLLREGGLTAPDKIVLAGAFGARIDPTRALILGMLPDCPVENVYSVGNAAGDGARIALLNRDRRRSAIDVIRSIRRIELPVDSSFTDEYVLSLGFPHMRDRFASIADLIPDHPTDPMADRLLGGRGDRGPQ